MIEVDKEYKNLNGQRVRILVKEHDQFVGENMYNGDLEWYSKEGHGYVDLVLEHPLDLKVGDTWLDHWNNHVYIASISPTAQSGRYPVIGIMYPNTIGHTTARYSRDGKAACASHYPLKEKIK
jgi:hypothetical protein